MSELDWILIHFEGVYAVMSDGMVYIATPKNGMEQFTETGIDQETGRATYKVNGVECLPEHMRIAIQPTPPATRSHR